MPQYAGMPEDTRNVRTDECGCVWRYYATIPEGWYRIDACDAHLREHLQRVSCGQRPCGKNHPGACDPTPCAKRCPACND